MFLKRVLYIKNIVLKRYFAFFVDANMISLEKKQLFRILMKGLLFTSKNTLYKMKIKYSLIIS